MASSPQLVPAVLVYDYVINAGDPAKVNPSPVVGAPVLITLQQNNLTSASPVTQMMPYTISVKTDANGYWSAEVPANNKLNPSGSTYLVQVGGMAPYQISVSDVSVPAAGWQSSAIVVNAPPAIGVSGPFLPAGTQVQGSLAIKGPDPWYDVMAYGAKGDGVTDDTAAIQAAITACKVTGGTVYFPPNTFRITAPLVISGNSIKLVGTGPQSSKILNASLSTDCVQVTGVLGAALAGVTIEDLWIDSATPASRTGGFGVNITWTQSCWLTRCQINDHTTCVTIGVGAKNTFVQDVQIYGALTTAISVGAGNNTNTPNGVYITNLLADTPTNSSANGIYINNGGGFNLVNVNVLHHTNGIVIAPTTYGAGLAQSEASWGFASQCQFDSNISNGMAILTSGAGAIRGWHFVDCWFSSTSAGQGVTINAQTAGAQSRVDEVSFTGCRFLHNFQTGINLTGNSATTNAVGLYGCTFAGNSTTGAGTYSGILIDQSFSNFRVIGGFSGFADKGASTDYANTQKYGLEINNAGSTNFVIANIDLGTNATGALSDATAATAAKAILNVTGVNSAQLPHSLRLDPGVGFTGNILSLLLNGTLRLSVDQLGQMAIVTSGSTAASTITDTGANGANLKLLGNGVSTPSKTVRVASGTLQVLNDAYTTAIMQLTDGGNLAITGALQPATFGATQAGALWAGSGAPANGNGTNGDFYFRTDTPGTVNQRLYTKSAGAWVGIV